MHPLETYLRDLQEIHSTGAGVKETSFYPPLANLLNAVGPQLRPLGKSRRTAEQATDLTEPVLKVGGQARFPADENVGHSPLDSAVVRKDLQLFVSDIVDPLDHGR